LKCCSQSAEHKLRQLHPGATLPVFDKTLVTVQRFFRRGASVSWVLVLEVSPLRAARHASLDRRERDTLKQRDGDRSQSQERRIRHWIFAPHDTGYEQEDDDYGGGDDATEQR
jgi:hypothetical protein